MAASTLLSVAGAGAGIAVRFSGEPRQLSHAETISSKKPVNLLSCSCRNKHPSQQKKCFWRISVIDSSNLKTRNFVSCFAFGKKAEDSSFSDINEDTDDMYDELLDKYGKVVFSRKDQKPASAELDDDAESLSFAVEMARVANDVKAADIRVLFVKPLVYWTRFFVIATAFSRPQIGAIGSKIRDLAEKKYGKIPTGDTKPNSWYLLDYGDVVIHIFLPPQRDFYNLEEFYANAPLVELPFESQPPFHS